FGGLVGTGLVAATLLGRPGVGAAATTLNATGDAYVYGGSATKNFGTANPEIASASQYRTLIKFDTSGIAAGTQLNSVDLLLYATDSISSGGFQVHPEAVAWSESGVTWNNQPSWNSKVLASSGAVVAGRTLDISLGATSVNTGAETDLALTYSSGGIQAKVASREDPAHPPQLVVVS